LLLLAAANVTNLLCQLEAALPSKQPGSTLPQSSPRRLFFPQQSLLLTLLFLPAVGLHRFWDLRSYTGRELALLTGRLTPYSYRHTERFLLQLSKLDGDRALTEALARWTASLWPVLHATERPSTFPCVRSTTGNSLVTCSPFVSVSTRSNHGFPTADCSFYMRPLHPLAETLSRHRATDDA
jgi:hypothetical protein